MDRRSFFKLTGLSLGAAAGWSVKSGSARAVTVEDDGEGWSILFDATMCEGCRACEESCAEANGNPVPDIDDESVFEHPRTTSETQWVAIDRRETSKGEVFVRRSCMHCNQPACATACLTKAMQKTDEGPIIYNEDRCMGCRYCMLSCPFEMPRYEYHSTTPKVQKCRMCYERVSEGGQPACVENCPAEAIAFGTRKEMLELAKSRIYSEPERYHHAIYGEREAGGTGLLYLSPVPFEELGFRTDLGTVAYPEYTKEFLYAVPVVFTLVPTFLLGLSRATGDSGHGSQGGAR